MTNTIRSLLQHSCQAQPIAWGGYANVYQFPPESGLNHFIIRQKRYPEFRKTLQVCTSLVPPHYLITGGNCGQILLQANTAIGDDYAIHLRQEGASLETLHRRALSHLVMRTPATEAAAAIGVLRALCELDGDAWSALLEKFMQVRTLGYTPDINLGNVMLDSMHGCLSLVDQFNTPRKEMRYQPGTWLRKDSQTLRETLHELFPDRLRTHVEQPVAAEATAMLAQLEQRIEHACAAAPKDIRPALHTVTVGNGHLYYGLPRHFPFTRIHHTHAIALTSPPQALTERLRALADTAKTLQK